MNGSPAVKDRQLPETFVLELTRRCNNRCVYCYLPGGVSAPNSEAARAAEMTLAEVCDLVAALREQLPLRTIALSGGEPLLREDLPQILSFLRELGVQPVVITNGTLLAPEKINALGPDVTFEIPLLSYRWSVHDQLVKRPGAWESVVANLTHLRRARGSFVAVFVATRINSTDLRKTAELAIALGADALMYNRINLGRHNFRRAAVLLPTRGMIEENLDTLEDIGEKYKLAISASVVIEPCVVDVTKYKHVHFGWCPLGGQGSYFAIDPLGNLRVCNHSPVVLGNLRLQTFASLYYEHPYLRRFRETWPAECRGCVPERRSLCCGGCKAAAEQCYGSMDRVDPFVTINLGLHTQPAATDNSRSSG